MLRRFTPYMVAGLTGVASGVYVFKPLFEEATANRNPASPVNMSTTSPEVLGKSPASSPSPHSSAK
ncbi:uncharacterized protein BJ212DRAFT_1367303 [Suillus subaureus]|uniref:Uncharacterized protein n=1 Tax=Suillus subaureus TaxID=48587 RepID=A0A9P7E7H1_9AGAM|nr:uncharacterized protein BJ212DRAFT_1367303 [Suillus subaureus]KAG1813225.1 hypothetical protein BJ212DRAFT_1367303 [Suillus subaureus]